MLQKLGYSEDEAIKFDKLAHNKVSNYGVCNWKYVNAIAAMEARKELNSVEVVNNLNRSLGLLEKEEYASKFDENLNGLSATNFIKEMKEGLDSELEESKKASAEKEHVANHRYTIIPMQDHEACTAFAPYVCWCITYDDSRHYDGYTNGGMGKFYICLRDDFKKYPDHKKKRVEPGPDAPLDDYGLSMIAVSVNPDGSCNTITTRWNHDNCKDADHAMTVGQLEDLLGVNFYETFKPRSKEELRELGYIGHDEVNAVLADGYDPGDLFTSIDPINGSDGLYEVCLMYDGACNVYNKSENRVISDVWFRRVESDMSEGWFVVADKEFHCNLMNKDGNLFFDEWIYFVRQPVDGAIVAEYPEDVYKLYDLDGNTITNESYSSIGPLKYGAAKVSKVADSGRSLYNFIRPDGTLVSEKWFSVAYAFQKNGYALILFKDGGQRYYDLLDLDGKLLLGGASKKKIIKADTEGWYVLENWSETKGCNLFYPPNTLVSDEWFDVAYTLGADDATLERDGVRFDATLSEDGSFDIEESKHRLRR